MDNEKNFLIAIIITVIVLLVYPIIIKQFFPQHFSSPEQTIQLAPEAEEESLVRPQGLRQVNPITYSKDKTYILENSLYKIVVNSPRADIKSIQLKKLIDPATKAPTVLMDTEDRTKGVFFGEGIFDFAQMQDVYLQRDTIEFHYVCDPALTLIKRISIDDELYNITLDLEITNLSSQDIASAYRMVIATGLNDVSGVENRFRNIVAIYDNDKTYKKNISSIKKENIIHENIKIAGFNLRYFSLLAIPIAACDYFYTVKHTEENSVNSASVGCGVSKLIIPANKTVNQKFFLYAGPNNYQNMAALRLDVEEVRGKGLFAGLSDLLLMLLRFLFKIFKNYGLAVIGLALIINVLLYPLTFKSLKSMKEMQAVQPLVEKLRTENKDNPQKLNKEIMGLYKKHKVNPAGGCLPLLFQMPVFFSLYGVLMRAIELRGASFLWIKNLAAPDAFLHFSTKYPFIGNSLNILPLCMALITFIQQKTSNPGHANDQQKAMAMMMPIFLGFIFYNFPSGLVLYFLTNSIFSFVVQTNLSRKIKPTLGTEA